MIPFVIKYIKIEDQELFEKIKNAINNLPEIDLGKDEDGEKVILSCHILARAIAKAFSLKYQDGYLYPNYQHSWIITKHGNLIDVYPVAILGGPILISGTKNSPIHWHYIKSSTRDISQGKFNKPSFKRSVKIITKEIISKALKD